MSYFFHQFLVMFLNTVNSYSYSQHLSTNLDIISERILVRENILFKTKNFKFNTFIQNGFKWLGIGVFYAIIFGRLFLLLFAQSRPLNPYQQQQSYPSIPIFHRSPLLLWTTCIFWSSLEIRCAYLTLAYYAYPRSFW